MESSSDPLGIRKGVRDLEIADESFWIGLNNAELSSSCVSHGGVEASADRANARVVLCAVPMAVNAAARRITTVKIINIRDNCGTVLLLRNMVGYMI